MNQYAPFTQNQIDFLHRSADSWFNVAEGGKRGGKNVLNTLAWCIELETHPDRFHLAAGVDQSSARINILECDGYGVKNYFDGRCRIGKFEKKDCLYVQAKAGQKIIFFAGGKKDGDESYIKGYTYGTAYITEANECHPKFIQEVFDRTISSNRRNIYHDLNPKSPNHAYYTDILEYHEKQQRLNPDYGYNWGKFTLLDNLSIDDKKLKRVLGTYDKGTVHYERDILGNRRQAEGIIYTRFANNADKYLIKPGNALERVPRLMEVSVGLDFGGNSSAHALVATGITSNYRELIALESERHFNKDYLPDGVLPATIDRIAVEFVGRVIARYGRCDYLEWDNESTTLGNGIHKAVGRVYPQVTVRPCYKAEIKDRIDLACKLVGEDRLYYTKNCKTLVNALKDAVWDAKAPAGEDRRLDDGSTDIDSLDGFEYTFTRNINRFIT